MLWVLEGIWRRKLRKPSVVEQWRSIPVFWSKGLTGGDCELSLSRTISTHPDFQVQGAYTGDCGSSLSLFSFFSNLLYLIVHCHIYYVTFPDCIPMTSGSLSLLGPTWDTVLIHYCITLPSLWHVQRPDRELKVKEGEPRGSTTHPGPVITPVSPVYPHDFVVCTFTSSLVLETGSTQNSIEVGVYDWRRRTL